LDSFAVAGEQYRILRAELSSLQKRRPMKSVIVTSAIPNEGKTFAACCLAGIFAKEQARKVLLIDADLRTANAGTVLGLHDYSLPGLCEVLSGKGEVEDYLLQCEELNLCFLLSGLAVEILVELLSSPRL